MQQAISWDFVHLKFIHHHLSMWHQGKRNKWELNGSLAICPHVMTPSQLQFIKADIVLGHVRKGNNIYLSVILII